MINLTSANETGLVSPRKLSPKHRLRISSIEDTVVIWLPEDLFELLSIVQTGEEMMRFVDHSKPQKLVISFDNVRTCGSQAVGDLIKLTKKVRGYGGDVKLCSMSSRVREVFDICRLIGPIFELYQSTGEAVESFGSSSR